MVPLAAWPLADSIAYLKRESGRRDITDDDAARLANELGSLPLALSHAAAYLRRTRTVSVDKYIKRLSEHMAQAPTGVDYPQAVFGTFRAAALRAEEESPGAIAVLCLSSFFAPEDIPEKLFGAGGNGSATGLRPPLPEAASLEATLGNADRIEENLGALDHFSLIAFFIERRRFAMHRLVQAAGRALIAADLPAWVECAVALVNAGVLEREDAIKTIEADLDNIRSVLRWSIDHRADVAGGAAMLNRLSTFWQATGNITKRTAGMRTSSRSRMGSPMIYERGSCSTRPRLRSTVIILKARFGCSNAPFLC